MRKRPTCNIEPFISDLTKKSEDLLQHRQLTSIEKTSKQMISLRISLFITVLLSSSNAATISSSLSESLEAHVHGRVLGHHRKLITVDDPAIVLDGQYIIVFDNDVVQNVTQKVEDVFVKEQVIYEYDNVAIKGVAIRNVTSELLHQLDMDSDILFMAPVRIRT
jgi:hypothetical protein